MTTRASLEKIKAEFDANVTSAVSGKDNIQTFIVNLSNIVGDLIQVVEEHIEKPFTKAHDKGREQ